MHLRFIESVVLLCINLGGLSAGGTGEYNLMQPQVKESGSRGIKCVLFYTGFGMIELKGT